MPRHARSRRPHRVRNRTAAYTAALAAILAGCSAVGAIAQADGTTPKPADTRFDNVLIAETALRYVGRWGGQACLDARHDASGQCKQFVNCVVALVSGGKAYPVDPHGNYQNSYLHAGGVEVTADAATAGDIIQIGARDDDPDLHTAVITARRADGTFTVVDANWVGAPATPELVGVHDWTPPPDARFWRLGTATPQTSNVRSPTAARGGSSAAAPGPPVLTASSGGGFVTGTITVNSTTAAHKDPAIVAMRLYLDDKPYATERAAGGVASVKLDTRTLTDGPHSLAAQAVTSAGMISPASGVMTLTVANTTLAATATLPSSPLLSGIAPITLATNASGPLKTIGWNVDGNPAPVTAGPGGKGFELDTGTLPSGAHQLSVTVVDQLGRTATSPATAFTVSTFATGHRVALDTTGSGLSDLIGIDPAGRLLTYRALGDGRFATPVSLWPDRTFGGVHALIGGHFTGAGGPAQLIAVWADHTVHLYTFDPAGHLSAGPPITESNWTAYTQLAVGASDGTTRILGIAADGHTDVITLSAAARNATTAVTSAAKVPIKTGTVIAADVGSTGTDDLLTADSAGIITETTYQSGTGFADERLGTVTAPAPSSAIIAGHFSTDGTQQLLITAPDGATVLQDRPRTAPTPPITAIIDTTESTQPNTNTTQRRHPTTGRSF